jgi:hypothetical protein
MLSACTQFVMCAMLLSACRIESRAQNAEAQQQLPPQTAAEQYEFPPTRLAELPPGPVIVNYQGDQLMIEAHNATLDSVLRAACYQTGTAVDIPASANERVFGVFGPGPAREVFASLLNGARFNYVMLGSASDGTKVVRLTLTARSVESQETRKEMVRSAPQPARSAPQAVDSVAATPVVPQSPQQAEKPVDAGAAGHSLLQELRRRHRR